MDGAALKQEREYDLAIAQAYHAAKFNALQKSGKIRGLSHYIGKKGVRKVPLASVAWGQRLKAAGFPVEISRVVH